MSRRITLTRLRHKASKSVMIDFYALTSPNVVKIFIALEEFELPYDVKPVDVWKSEQHSEAFAKLNPNKKIPVIVDHDGPGGKPYTVFESGAILMYLAEKQGKFLPQDMATRYEVIQWLMVQMSTMGPMFGQVVHFTRFAPGSSDHSYAKSRYLTEAHRLYDLFDQRLAAHPYVGGTEYTIADMAAFPWLRNFALLGLDISDRTHVKAWIDKLAERPAVKRALAKVGGMTSSRDSASEDDKDRFFNRGKYARA
jgi:GSH-dependent disulfide-bond oxidoreductase